MSSSGLCGGGCLISGDCGLWGCRNVGLYLEGVCGRLLGFVSLGLFSGFGCAGCGVGFAAVCIILEGAVDVVWVLARCVGNWCFGLLAL